jgi:hypothetical protein
LINKKTFPVIAAHVPQSISKSPYKSKTGKPKGLSGLDSPTISIDAGSQAGMTKIQVS